MDAVCMFDRLRIKTNTELVQLISHELDFGAAGLPPQWESYPRAARACFRGSPPDAYRRDQPEGTAPTRVEAGNASRMFLNGCPAPTCERNWLVAPC